jgi:hypothetical protein
VSAAADTTAMSSTSQTASHGHSAQWCPLPYAMRSNASAMGPPLSLVHTAVTKCAHDAAPAASAEAVARDGRGGGVEEWGARGQRVRLQGRRAGWGPGWVRMRWAVPVGSVARWRVSVSQEHGGGVHVLGVVSERFNDWDGTTRRGCDGNWVVLNDISWACGKQLDSSWEEIFAAGETVSLTLDRCAHTLTVVGSGRIVVFRDLPAGGDLYPALAFTNSEQYSEVLDYSLDSLTPSSSAGGEDAADGKAKVASEVPLYACMVVHAGYLSHSKLNAGLPACHCWRLPTLHATERHDAACTRNPSPSLCAERASAPVCLRTQEEALRRQALRSASRTSGRRWAPLPSCEALLLRLANMGFIDTHTNLLLLKQSRYDVSQVAAALASAQRPATLPAAGLPNRGGLLSMPTLPLGRLSSAPVHDGPKSGSALFTFYHATSLEAALSIQESGFRLPEVSLLSSCLSASSTAPVPAIPAFCPPFPVSPL